MKKETYFRILIFIIMGIVFLPVISYRLPHYIGSWVVWSIIWGVSLLLLKPQVLWSKMMLITLFYGLFLWIMLSTLWKAMDSWNSEMLKNEFLMILVAVSILSYFNVSNDYVGFAKIIKYSLIFIGITAIMTIYASILNPMYVRFMAQDSMKGEVARALVFRLGTGNYGTVILFMSILPVLIYYFKNNQQFFIHKKWMILVFLVVVFIATLRMQLFTNISIGFLVSILALISAKNRVRNGVLIGVIALIIVAIPQRVYIDTLNNLSEITQGTTAVSFKFQEFAVYLQSGGVVKDNEVSVRASRFPVLVNAFQDSPFLGCFYPPEANGYGYDGMGGHLYWMNKLATCGIFGLLFFISIILVFIKNQVKEIKGEYRYYFLLSLFSIILYGIFKNITGKECWLAFFVIIPGMYYIPLLRTKNSKTGDTTKNEIKTLE